MNTLQQSHKTEKPTKIIKAESGKQIVPQTFSQFLVYFYVHYKTLSMYYWFKNFTSLCLKYTPQDAIVQL